MSFCSYNEVDGMFILTLNGSDGGHNSLTLDSMAELHQTLKEIRGKATRSSRGLVTTCKGGSFCAGVDYHNSSPAVVDELAYRMAEAVRELFSMPFPSVAAVSGDVKTSLALAFVLAHDDIAAWKEAKFETAEVRDGRDNLPSFLAALLRDKAPYPLMCSSLVLQSEAMDASKMAWWYLFDTKCDTREEVEGKAIRMVSEDFGDIRDGYAYITTRKSFFPESWKAVSEFLGGNQ